MGLGDDLSSEALAEVMPGRSVRTYPAILATSADAFAWARAGAPEGAVVVADYQASPRGRAGLPWEVRPGQGLGFSLVLRPELPPEREGWLYSVAVSGIADVVGPEARIRWPDEVLREGAPAGAVGVHVELGPQRTDWAVVTALVLEAQPSRAPLLARLIAAIEDRYHGQAEAVLNDYLPRCETLGRRVRARLIPLGPSGPQVVGVAVNCLDDGALVLETDSGNRVAVRPQNLGILEEAL